MKALKNYINGEWVESKAEEFGEVWCPATGEKIGEVPFSTAAEVDADVRAAKEAYWEDPPGEVWCVSPWCGVIRISR